MARRRIRHGLLIAAVLAGAAIPAVQPAPTPAPAAAHPEEPARDPDTSPPEARAAALALYARTGLPRLAAAELTQAPCQDSMAGSYPCRGVDLVSTVSLSAMGGGTGNDVWGWTAPGTRREFVVMGRSTGTAFVEITDPARPLYLGNLPAEGGASMWRDVKVVGDHALVVSEAPGSGMQVFDLRRLLDVGSPPATLTPDAVYTAVSSAHNLAVNETSGHAYLVGTNTCGGGLHIVDVSNPAAPVPAGCFSGDGYTHDAQCVRYRGPDPDHAGADICVAANEDTVTVVDVSDPARPSLIARAGYVGAAYAHQAWLTEDHRHLLLGDELDETFTDGRTTTYLWDVTNLDDPEVIGRHVAKTSATDHNQYVRDGHTYQANYRAGVRVLDVSRIADGLLTEVGFFDIYPADDARSFNGAWSVYPFFPSGLVAVSGIDQGLFILYPTGARPSVHVIDLDDRSRTLEGGAWRARAKVKVSDEGGAAVSGVKVKVRFATGAKRTCVTDSRGRCFVKIRLETRDKVKMRVKRLVLDGADHAFWANEDVDGSTDGTRIQLRRP